MKIDELCWSWTKNPKLLFWNILEWCPFGFHSILRRLEDRSIWLPRFLRLRLCGKFFLTVSHQTYLVSWMFKAPVFFGRDENSLQDCVKIATVGCVAKLPWELITWVDKWWLKLPQLRKKTSTLCFSLQKNLIYLDTPPKITVYGVWAKNKQTFWQTYAKCCIDKDDTTRPWGKQSNWKTLTSLNHGTPKSPQNDRFTPLLWSHKKLQKERLGPQLEKSLWMVYWWDWKIKMIGFEA